MKHTYLSILFVTFLSLTFSSCVTNKQKTYLQEEGKRKMYTPKPFEEYRLTVNDEVTYFLMTTNEETQQLYNRGISGESNTNRQTVYRIYEDGCLVLPTLGRIPVAGLTLREAERVVSEAFKDVILDAEVKMSLANNYFYMLGDNGKGQYFMYKENLTIYQALALAGDLSSMAHRKHIKVIRKGIDGKDHIETFDLRKESVLESEYYYVRPNDVIYIPTNPNSFFRIESISGFVSMIVTPLSLLIMALSYF